MTLGIALLLIFILYLIDKHSLWRQAAKIAVGFVVLVVLAVSGVYGWSRYDEYHIDIAKQQQVQRQREADAGCAKLGDYVAVGVDDQFPHGLACRPTTDKQLKADEQESLAKEWDATHQDVIAKEWEAKHQDVIAKEWEAKHGTASLSDIDEAAASVPPKAKRVVCQGWMAKDANGYCWTFPLKPDSSIK